MRYVIIGAGAVGGTIGGRLSEAGHEVVLVARGAHAEALRARGLRLELPDGDRVVRTTVVEGPGELRPREDDVLVLAVKTQDTAAALAAWADYGVGTGGASGPGPGSGPDSPGGVGGVGGGTVPVVCAQNGVANERAALRVARDVYGMCVWLPSSYLEPGVVRAPCAPLTGILHIGRFPAGSDATARRIGADLEASGFGAPVSDEVMAWKYAKLLANLGNAAEAVCGPGDPARELTARARSEGAAVLAAAGIAHTSPDEQARVRADRARPQPVKGEQRAGGSSWQSLVRGTGSIEADYLNGEIVLLSRLHGVPAPVNEALRRTANRFAREHRRPGSVTDTELAALLRA